MRYNEEGGNGVLWFLAGVSFGAAVALLYAPRSGRVTRRYLSRKASKAQHFVSDRAEDARDFVSEPRTRATSFPTEPRTRATSFPTGGMNSTTAAGKWWTGAGNSWKMPQSW